MALRKLQDDRIWALRHTVIIARFVGLTLLYLYEYITGNQITETKNVQAVTEIIRRTDGPLAEAFVQTWLLDRAEDLSEKLHKGLSGRTTFRTRVNAHYLFIEVRLPRSPTPQIMEHDRAFSQEI